MHGLYRTDQLRSIEQAVLASLPAGTLMERAGHAAATRALTMLDIATSAKCVLVLAGPGNNGGDALVAATALAQAGIQVQIMLCTPEQPRPADAEQALHKAQAAGLHFVSALPAQSFALIIDGLFGIGLQRPISGSLRELVLAINTLKTPVLALDVPSGLSADTGTVIGDGGVAVRATHTITFLADKPGLHTGAGRDYAGTITVAALDVDPAQIPDSPIKLGGAASFATLLQPRPHDSHKGSYGDVTILGGAAGMSGAAILAARAALYGGAGRVFAAFVGSVPDYDPLHPEIMCRHATDVVFGKSVVVAGPGLGQAPVATQHLLRLLQTVSHVVVLDADALNLLAIEPELAALLPTSETMPLLTPHPLEAARLLGCSAARVQADRLAAASKIAHRYQAVVILKGSGSVIAHPDGRLVINPTGNPSLATAGTGDVLAGWCGALLAQGWPTWKAAQASVWLHGRAADTLVKGGTGPVGLTASELLPQLRREFNLLIASVPLQS